MNCFLPVQRSTKFRTKVKGGHSNLVVPPVETFMQECCKKCLILHRLRLKSKAPTLFIFFQYSFLCFLYFYYLIYSYQGFCVQFRSSRRVFVTQIGSMPRLQLGKVVEKLLAPIFVYRIGRLLSHPTFHQGFAFLKRLVLGKSIFH